MANIKPERAFAKAAIRCFPGISGESPLDGASAAAEMVNFRPRADGAIEMRSGYGRIFTTPGVPRTAFSGYHEGEEVLYFLIGNGIYRYYEGDEYGYLFCGTVATDTGDAEFAVYHGKLYLFDGDAIYVKEGSRFTVAEGYLPLYGDGWNPTDCGPVSEEENLLTPRVRIRYRNTEEADRVIFPRRVESVDALRIDGVTRSTVAVTLANTGTECSCEDFCAAKDIELIVTLHTAARGEEIRSCTKAFPFGAADGRSLLCRGGADASEVRASVPVSAEAADESDAFGGGYGGALYFPVSRSAYRLDAPVTALCRHYGKLLLFTGSGAWVMDPRGESVTQVNAVIGCDKADGAVLCGNTPVTYFGGRLWAWSTKRESENEYSASVISGPVASAVARMQRRRVLMQYYPSRSELWLSAPSDGSGDVLIYNTERESFYRFSGIGADRLLASAEDALFLRGTELMQMNNALTTDEGEREIDAIYESGWLDFGYPERTKRTVRYLLEGDPDGGEITLRMQSERGNVAAAVFTGNAERVPNAYGGRMTVGRFRYLSYSLTARGTGRATVRALTVTARK